MKRKFFLSAGLLVTAFGLAQNSTVAYPSTITATGEKAGTGGYRSVHIGHQAGYSADEDTDRNIFIGKSAGYNTVASSSQNGFSNSFVGYLAGYENVTGYNNTYIGAAAGRDNLVGERNTFIGEASGLYSTGGELNTFIGSQSGYSFLNGNYNVFLGPDSGYHNGSGEGNIFLGFKSGFTTTGSFNIFIGHQAGMDETDSNKLYIANSRTPNPLIHGDFSINELKFNAEKVGIGYEDETDDSIDNGGFGDFPANTAVDYSDYRLFVRGGILAEEVRIRTYDNWADYVFAEDYKLQPLSEVEAYIKNNGHLPNMPSAEEVQKEGLAVSEIIKLQQEKIEELTLHLIEQEKEMKLLKEQVQQLLNKE